jgi:hypothetical protein
LVTASINDYGKIMALLKHLPRTHIRPPFALKALTLP